MNKFEQLVKDLDNGELRLKHIQNALCQHYRNANHIPGPIKDLLCGRTGANGLITSFFFLIDQMIGSMEVAFRRGKNDNL